MAISTSGSGEGLGWVTGRGYSTDGFQATEPGSRISTGRNSGAIWSRSGDNSPLGLRPLGERPCAEMRRKYPTHTSVIGVGWDVESAREPVTLDIFGVPWLIVGANGTGTEVFSHNLSGGVWVFQSTNTAQGQFVYAKFSLIPEPSTAMLVGLGLVAIGIRARRAV